MNSTGGGWMTYQESRRDSPGQRLFFRRQRRCPCRTPVTGMVVTMIVMTVMVTIGSGIVWSNHPGVVGIQAWIGIEKVRQLNAILS